MACSHRQIQQLSHDDVDDAPVAPHHLHRVCYQPGTKCWTPDDCSPTNTLRGRASSPLVVAGTPDAAGGNGRPPAHIVIDALRTTTSDDEQHRLRRLPTSQIICRIIQPSTVGRYSPADNHSTGSRKPIIPVCDDRQCRTSAPLAQTGFTNDDRQSCGQQHTLPALHRHVDANGNKQL